MRIKKVFSCFVWGLIEAVAIFAMIFSIKYITVFEKNRGFLVSGAEIVYQELFAPYYQEKLDEMDALLKEKYSFYKGYSYNDITTVCRDFQGTEHYVYMADESIQINKWFGLKEGGYFTGTDNTEGSQAVIVGGEYYDDYKIGDSFTMILPNAQNAADTTKVNVHIVGKIDEANFRYPESISHTQAVKMIKDGFIVCGDTYLAQAVDLSTKQVWLNYDNFDKNFKKDNKELLKADAEFYGNFATPFDLTSNDVYQIYAEGFSQAKIMAVTCAILIVMSAVWFCMKSKTTQDMLASLFAQLIAVVISIVSIIIFNIVNSTSILIIGELLACSVLGIALAIYLVSLIRYLIYNKTNKKVAEGNKYEKI